MVDSTKGRYRMEGPQWTGLARPDRPGLSMHKFVHRDLEPEVPPLPTRRIPSHRRTGPARAACFVQVELFELIQESPLLTTNLPRLVDTRDDRHHSHEGDERRELQDLATGCDWSGKVSQSMHKRQKATTGNPHCPKVTYKHHENCQQWLGKLLYRLVC